MNNLRNLALWIVVALLLVFLFNLFQGTAQHANAQNITYTKFVDEVNQNQVKAVTMQGDAIKGELANGQPFTTMAPTNDSTLVPLMKSHNVNISVSPPDDGFNLMGVLLNALPMLLLIGVWIFFMRQLQAGGGKAMGFGKSRAKMLTERTGRVTFEDVAGVDEAKDDLKEIVDFLKDPQKFQRLGGRIPKGVLLVGPPGTGKTLLARAIAGEANVPFFTISGSDFVEMFVGVGASRVRDMFEQAKKNAPCIVFIDEIDAVGRHRGAGLGGGNDEREQTLNQLLVEMDGFESTEGVILIAATNRPDVLDPALLRPGRFDRHVVVANPDLGGREKILRVHLRKVPLAPDVEPRTIARGTPGFSGADLANLVNEAALLAARRGKRVVTMSELEDAKDKVMMGAERRSMVMSEDEKKLTAYHEGGHAIVAVAVEGSDPIHKATIIPRGRALGMVMRLPERDQLSLTRQKMLADLCVAFGGRIAEELVFGHEMVTTGASSDIEQATRMARAMVTRFGMSDDLGPIAYSENQEEVFLGHSVSRTQNVSEATAQKIDAEIRRIIDECYRRAYGILSSRIGDLHTVAKGLLEYETLTGDEIVGLMKGIKPIRTPYEEPAPERSQGTERAGRRASTRTARARAATGTVSQKTEYRRQGSDEIGEGIRSPSFVFDIQILGILNITEDSFSDGAKYLEPAAAIAHGRALLADGAAILDIGAASSNPESKGVPPEVEIARLEPVVAALKGAALSIDTYSLTVQRWALAHDVSFINDIQGFPDAVLYPELATSSAKLIVMHSVQERGGATRVDVPPEAIMARLFTFFDARIAALERAGIARARLILDPGMGFFLGTNPETSFTVLRRLPELKARFGLPTLVSVSRKSFLRRLTGRTAAGSGAASLAAELFAVRQGADYIRTHAPGPLRDALLLEKALRSPL